MLCTYDYYTLYPRVSVKYMGKICCVLELLFRFCCVCTGKRRVDHRTPFRVIVVPGPHTHTDYRVQSMITNNVGTLSFTL